MIARQGHLYKGRSQQIVAREHGHLVVEHGVHRELSATLAAFVHHIVVHQAGIVEQLQRHGRMKSRRRNRAAQLSRKQHQHRPHHLPAPLADVFDYTVEQRIGAGKRTGKQLPEVFQLSRNGGLYH